MSWSWLDHETAPLFVYDGDAARENVRALRRALMGAGKVFYSVKANPNPYLIRALDGAVDGFDVSSEGELDLLLRLKTEPARISLSGPAHRAELLKRAFAAGVFAVLLDSPENLEAALSLPRGTTRVTLRLNLGGGAYPKLGFMPEHLESLAAKIPAGFFAGIHFYGGRESFTVSGFREHVSAALALRERWPQFFSPRFELYAGPGVPALTVADLGPGVLDGQGAALNIEAGRAVAASAGQYAAPVAAVKTNASGRRVIIIRGGTQHLGGSLMSPAYGTRGLRVECYRSSGKFGAEKTACTIFGSLCLSNDAVHPDVQLPADLRAGDWLIFHPCGAYGLTASANQFIAQDLPKEYLLENGQRSDASGGFGRYHESFTL